MVTQIGLAIAGSRRKLDEYPYFSWVRLEQAVDAQGNATVQRSKVKFAILMLSVVIPPMCHAAPPSAAVSGVVRDSQGVAQMGALVQIVSGDSALAKTAFTDLHGRYIISNLMPGRYRVRASAALFVPALRDNVQVRTGARAVVNLTLSTLFDTTSWLPAERRKSDEPGDDWKWTLRSAANRSILRMVEDGQIILISSSATEGPHVRDTARGSVSAGSGDFGGGGVHSVLSVDRVLDDGADVILRIDMGSELATAQGRPSMEFQTGYERKLGFGGAARTLVSYQSHPELMQSGQRTGLDAIRVASVEKFELGDTVELEAGSALDIVHTLGYAVMARPFLRISAHPATDWTIGYRMATGRDLQSFEALDGPRPDLPVAIQSQGAMRMESGVHQEVSVARKVGRGTIQVAYYHDRLDEVMLAGSGEPDMGGGPAVGAATGVATSAAVSAGYGVMSDTATGSFRVPTAGYRTQGVNITFTQPLTAGIWTALEYNNGDGLAADPGGLRSLAETLSRLSLRQGESATIALRGRVVRSGTNVRAAYRWQPRALVTPIDSYGAFSDQAFFSLYLRQPVSLGHWLPQGLDATVDVTNLLAQGYRPFLSADGRTLYLAQSPRTLQAGLSFNF